MVALRLSCEKTSRRELLKIYNFSWCVSRETWFVPTHHSRLKKFLKKSWRNNHVSRIFFTHNFVVRKSWDLQRKFFRVSCTFTHVFIEMYNEKNFLISVPLHVRIYWDLQRKFFRNVFPFTYIKKFKFF